MTTRYRIPNLDRIIERIVSTRTGVATVNNWGHDTQERTYTTEKVWASKRDIRSADENFAAGRVAVGDSVFIIRYSPGWKVDDVFLDDEGHHRKVMALTEIGRREFIELTARRGT